MIAASSSLRSRDESLSSASLCLRSRRFSIVWNGQKKAKDATNQHGST